ncbi:MAG: glycosyltransferase [Polyangiales bacterium]
MLTLVWILLACAAFALGLFSLGVWSTIRHTSAPPPAFEGELPPLSILKPLKGTEEGLEENLRSFFEQTYPAPLEIVFSAEEDDDPGMVLARRVAAKYPDVDVRFVLSDPHFGLNPKVSNLHGAYVAAKYDLVLQSDANVRASQGYLERIVRELLAERAALLSSIVVGVGERSIGAALENLQLTALIGPSMCTALHVAGVNCVVGKSMLMRRSDVQALGGLEDVRDILCEDFILGQKFQQSGRKVLLSTNILENYNHDHTVKQFLARHSRWMKMRVVIHVGSYLADLFANPVFFGFAAMLASGFDRRVVAAFVGIVLYKLAADAFLVRRLRGEPMAFRLLLLGPIKDLVMAGVWFYSMFSRSVVWRGRKLRFGKESRLRHDEGNLGERLAKRLLG